MLSCMTFQDLPKNWHARPLTDPDLAPDVVDLVVREGDRAVGCLSLLLCDDDHRMVQPVTITDLDRGHPEHRRHLFDLVVGELAEHLGGVVVAVGRPRGAVPDDEARGWHEAAIAACRAHDVPLLGTYLATTHGVVEMPRWDGLEALAG